jgi:hypothetical protein
MVGFPYPLCDLLERSGDNFSGGFSWHQMGEFVAEWKEVEQLAT